MGLEVLHFRPVPVELQPAEGGDPVPALFLAGVDRSGTMDALLVDPSVHTPGRPMQLRAQGSKFQLRLGEAQRSGVDWLVTGFEVDGAG